MWELAHLFSANQDDTFVLTMQYTSGYAKYDAIMLWLRDKQL